MERNLSLEQIERRRRPLAAPSSDGSLGGVEVYQVLFSEARLLRQQGSVGHVAILTDGGGCSV